jgi:biopolymer transport protein ExbB
MLDPSATSRKCRAYALLMCVLMALASIWLTAPGSSLRAQEPAASDSPATADSNPLPAEPAGSSPDAESAPADLVRVNEEEGINFFALLLTGGWFMVPIGLLSVLVVTITIERLLGLRQARVLPAALVQQLGQLAANHGSFDPREAYRACQQYPSAAANVVRAMLLKVGRPHSEVEHSVAEASEREAERLYANVRWLNLAAGVGPLLGLLGTVWGMIEAFHRTSTLAPGQNKAEELATGIYIALVTTFGGLMVAIPAAIFAHLFEGRIQRLFHQIDEMLFNLLPQIERFEGRMRFGQQPGDGQPSGAAAEPPQVAAPPRRA